MRTKNYILATKGDHSIGVMQATTFKAAKQILIMNNLDPNKYELTKKERGNVSHILQTTD